MSKLGDVRTSERGFQKIVFGDANDQRCSLQQSSAIDGSLDGHAPGAGFVWLGVDYGSGDDKSVRMHLNRRQVKSLRRLLKRWLENGTFT